jgi:ABC-type lipoprotein export system ATPase subunit
MIIYGCCCDEFWRELSINDEYVVSPTDGFGRMLKDVLVDSFRSCVATHIQDIGGILVLLGRNGTGKTNLLRAIEWAARSMNSTDALLAEIEPRKVTLVVELGSWIYQYAISSSPVRATPTEKSPFAFERLEELVRIKAVPSDQWEQLVVRKNEHVHIGAHETLSIGAATPCIPALASILPADHTLNQRLRPLRSFLAGVRYYPLDEPNDLTNSGNRDLGGLVPKEEYARWVVSYKTTGNTPDSVLLRILHMHFERPDQFRELLSLLGSQGLGVIDNIEIKDFNTSNGNGRADANDRVIYGVTFRPSHAARSFDFSDLSVGTRRVLRILVSLLFDSSSVLLLEHPEDAIHSHLLRRLISLLKTYADPHQFILASHSPDVFNQLAPDEIRLVTMNNGITQLRPLTPLETQTAEKFVQRDGSLADFLESIQEL